MAFLLISVTVLHLVALATLLIATLEKVRRAHALMSEFSYVWREETGDADYSFLSFLQSWWVWTDSEISDLWYNCFHDNDTETWLCAATNESGKDRLGYFSLALHS